MLKIAIDDMRGWFGLGVAGNFAGHLEQAGEAAAFAAMEPADADDAREGIGVGPAGAAAQRAMPKGIFPFYVPGRDGFLGKFPLSDVQLAVPSDPGADNLQIEPEAAIVCHVDFSPSGAVSALRPIAIGAFNDCSIRRPGVVKISEKKNWGADSKGVASMFFEIDEIEPDGATAHLRLASFLRRGEDTYAYGADSAVADYSLYGDELLAWIADRLNRQDGPADSPLEPVGQYLNDAGRPGKLLIGVGSTMYTPFGESTYLQPGDDSLVVLYDSLEYSPGLVAAAVAARREDELSTASVLRQRVYAAGG